MFILVPLFQTDAWCPFPLAPQGLALDYSQRSHLSSSPSRDNPECGLARERGRAPSESKGACQKGDDRMPKRRTARVAITRPVEIQGPHGISHGTLCDFSPSGARVCRTEVKVHCGMRLTLRFSLPDRMEPIELKQAVVSWVGTHEFGIGFPKPSRELRARFETVYELLLDAQTADTNDRVISLRLS